jgi:hypothetical protein
MLLSNCKVLRFSQRSAWILQSAMWHCVLCYKFISVIRVIRCSHLHGPRVSFFLKKGVIFFSETSGNFYPDYTTSSSRRYLFSRSPLKPSDLTYECSACCILRILNKQRVYPYFLRGIAKVLTGDVAHSWWNITDGLVRLSKVSIKFHNIFMCRVRCVTYRRGSGLDDWIYWHLIHTTRDYRQHCAVSILRTLMFTITHALEFSAFSSRVLATDLSQSHCNFNSHMKFSFYNLIHSLSFLLNHSRLPSPELGPILDNSLKRPSLSLYKPSARTTQETQLLYCWESLFTGPLSSIRRPTFVRVRFRWNTCSQSFLPMGLYITLYLAVLCSVRSGKQYNHTASKSVCIRKVLRPATSISVSPWFSSVLEQVLSWCTNSALHSMLHMQPFQWKHQNFALMLPSQRHIKINSDHMHYLYQKDERTVPGNLHNRRYN